MPGAPIFKFDDHQIIEALEATRCNFTQAAVFLAKKWGRSCHRNYVARNVKQRPRLVAFVRDYRASAIDQAEANIFRQVEDGDYSASALVLTTLGKERGWVPKYQKDKTFSPKDRLAAMTRGHKRAKDQLGAAPAGQSKRA